MRRRGRQPFVHSSDNPIDRGFEGYLAAYWLAAGEVHTDVPSAIESERRSAEREEGPKCTSRFSLSSLVSFKRSH